MGFKTINRLATIAFFVAFMNTMAGCGSDESGFYEYMDSRYFEAIITETIQRDAITTFNESLRDGEESASWGKHYQLHDYDYDVDNLEIKAVYGHEDYDYEANYTVSYDAEVELNGHRFEFKGVFTRRDLRIPPNYPGVEQMGGPWGLGGEGEEQSPTSIEVR